jgi:hypothetical protein
MGRQVPRRRASVLLGVAGLVAVGLSGSGTAAADLTSFSASAMADGGRMGLFVPGASISDQVIDGGGPVAQADIDSLGGSRAFAATPYPGELGVIGPGIVTSLLGLPAPPNYPFIAASRYPATPENHVEYGQFYRLQARSSQDSSEASARTSEFGGDIKILASRATARVASEAGTVLAAAGNTFDGITAGPLRIAAVESSATVNQPPAGEPARQSSLVVTGVSIDGQAIGFSDKGFVVGSDAQPLPPSDPLMGALEQAGVTVTYLQAETTPSGIVAPGLRIVAVRDIPGAQRTVTLALTLGRASATVEATSEATGSVGLPATDEPGPAGNASTEATAPASDQTPGPPTVADAGTDLTPVSAVAYADPATPSLPDLSVGTALELAGPTGEPAGPSAATAASAPTPALAGAAAGEVAAPTLVRNAWWAKKIDGGAFYPLLLVAGALLIAGLRATRKVGVKA